MLPEWGVSIKGKLPWKKFPILKWTFYGNSEVLRIPDSIPSHNSTIDSPTWKEIQSLINSICLFHERESLD